MASVDEPAQLLEAWAVTHGEALHRPVLQTPLGPESLVGAPASLRSLEGSADCLVLQPRADGSCVRARDPAPPGSTQFGGYPPAYYAVVGLPTLVADGTTAARLARAVSAALTAALLALACTTLVAFGGRSAPVALAAALTPAVVTFSGVLNSSDLEIAAAVLSWCALVPLARRDDVPRRLVATAAVGLSALLLARPASPLYALTAVLVCGVLAGRRRLRSLSRDTAVRRGAAATAGAAALAGAWRLLAGPTHLLGVPPRPSLSVSAAVRQSMSATGERLASLAGNFLGLHAPLLATSAALLLLAGALWSCLVAGDRRQVTSCVLLLLVTVAAPIALEVATVPQIGFQWQARYTLPWVVGLPVVALCGEHAPARAARRVSSVWFVAMASTSVAVLHRWTNGSAWPYVPVHPGWQPPGGGWAVALVAVASAAGLAVALARSTHPAAAAR